MKSKKILSGLMALSVVVSSSLMIGTTAKAAPVQNNVKIATSPKLEQSQILETKSIATSSNSKYVIVRTMVPVYTSGGQIYGGYNLNDTVPYFTDSEGYSGRVKCLDTVDSPELQKLASAYAAKTYYSTTIEYVFGGTVTKTN
ncbi:hypothetical protein [Clostridium sp. JS66]|uniref:hypothetical protein n=1 Tax=Clostridium sp. JS66 TaxID=3064705 RepID=UPI00298E1C1C|nr:hypothetical protein [Clostridium sp. JS66]WPC41212.1 hypothetical protein Q6H37_25485 [Clostridium sp. JS66]